MSKVWIVFQPDGNCGPEPQRLGNPYNFVFTPGVPFEINDAWAKQLTAEKPQFKIVDPPAVTEVTQGNDDASAAAEADEKPEESAGKKTKKAVK